MQTGQYLNRIKYDATNMLPMCHNIVILRLQNVLEQWIVNNLCKSFRYNYWKKNFECNLYRQERNYRGITIFHILTMTYRKQKDQHLHSLCFVYIKKIIFKRQKTHISLIKNRKPRSHTMNQIKLTTSDI